MSAVIECRNIVKRFGNLIANDNITIRVNNNTVHCILGENGAGKTTLMKIFFGVLQPDSGEVFISEQKIRLRSARDAISSGIGMLFQNFQLIDNFTVIENVILGREITKGIVIDFGKTREILKFYIDNYNLGLELDKEINELSVGEQQKVEILKLLYRDSEIMIFDEPTAVLSPYEVSQFFEIISSLKKAGKTIILITHKLSEVERIADFVTVLRRGKVVYETNRKELNIEEVAKQIVGDITINQTEQINRLLNEKKEVAIEIKNLTLVEKGIKYLSNLNLKIYFGEIYGVCGVEGNGQKEFVDLIMGLRKANSGIINIKADGISLVPDDRLKKGMIKEFSIGENVLLRMKTRLLWTRGKSKNIADKIIKDYDIKVGEADVTMASLSGGNQQKVIVAREIFIDNKILVFHHPTRGVDIIATEYIHSKMIEQKNQGKAIILISSELEELLKLSDRLGIMYKGSIICEFDEKILQDKNDFLIEKIGKLMIGIDE
ncbi:MAG: ABC transporter ATP-binding protein [Ignavibacteria bacterium]